MVCCCYCWMRVCVWWMMMTYFEWVWMPKPTDLISNSTHKYTRNVVCTSATVPPHELFASTCQRNRKSNWILLRTEYNDPRCDDYAITQNKNCVLAVGATYRSEYGVNGSSRKTEKSSREPTFLANDSLWHWLVRLLTRTERTNG